MHDATPHEIVHGGMTLAQFAELTALARLVSPPFHEVLASRGLSNETWSDARNAWNLAIEHDIDRGADGLVVAFADALAEAKERLRRSPLQLDGRSGADGSERDERAREKATFQRPGFDRPGLERPSFERMGLERPSAEGPSIAQIPEEKPEMEITSKVPIQGILQRVLPFQAAPPEGSPAAVPSPAPAAAQPAKRAGSLGGTADLVIPRVLPKPLPFGGRDASGGDPPEETMAVSAVQAIGMIAGLPIGAPAAQPISPAAANAPPQSTRAPLVSGGRLTPEQQATLAPHAPGASLPANAPPPSTRTPSLAAAGPRLTPEQYASLTAELAEHPDRAAEVRARYYVAHDAAWNALQAEWQQRMIADPRLRQRITELVAHYRSWLKRTGG